VSTLLQTFDICRGQNSNGGVEFNRDVLVLFIFEANDVLIEWMPSATWSMPMDSVACIPG